MKGPPSIKPLRWQKTHSTLESSIYTADTPLGTGSIVASASGQVWFCGFLGETLEADLPCASLARAQEVAQREFEHIVRACLSTHTQSPSTTKDYRYGKDRLKTS